MSPSELVFSAGLAVLVVTTAVLLFAKLFAKDAATREAVLFFAVCLSFATPLAVVVVECLGVSLREPIRLAAIEPSPLVEASGPFLVVTHDSTSVRPARTISRSTTGQLAIPQVSLRWSIVSNWLLFLWGGIAGLLLLHMLWGWRRLKRMLASSTPITDAVALRSLEHAKRSTDFQRAILLFESHETNVPIVVGILNPRIVLPRLWKEITHEQVLDVLLHEVMHLKRYDTCKLLIQRLAAAMYWPVFTLHLVNWILIEAREEVCDNGVISKRDAVAYGETLLQVARLVTNKQHSFASVGFLRTRNKLENRICRLFESNSEHRISPSIPKLVPAAFALALAAIGMVVLAAKPQVEVADGNSFPRKSKKEVVRVSPQLESESEEPSDVTGSGLDLEPEVEKSVARGIAYLMSKQNDDGSAGSSRQVAVTSLLGVALMDAGVKLDERDRGKSLRRSIDYVKRAADAKGMLGIELYSHSYALRFLAQVKRRFSEEDVDSIVRSAIELLVKSQSDHRTFSKENPMGGWRYSPESSDMDVSVTSCATLALLSAKEAGFDVPDNTLQRATKYLERMQRTDGGFYYTSPFGSENAVARSAAAMSVLLKTECLNDQRRQLGLSYLADTPPSEEAYFYFAHYYLSEALLFAPKSFNSWYRETNRKLLKMQQSDGHWPGVYGDEYSTAKACIVLLSRPNEAERALETED